VGPILAIPASLIAGGVTQIAAAAGASLATQAAIGSIVTALGTIAIATGLSFLLGALFKPEVPEPSGMQVETQQTIPPRHFVYGRMELSGPLAIKKVQDATSKLHKIVLLHDGELDYYAIEAVMMDDKIVLIDPSDNYITNAFIQDAVQRVQVFLHYGAEDQEANSQFVIDFPGVWTEDHRLLGTAYAAVICYGTSAEDFTGAYPNGEPNLKVIMRGRRLWDPRDGTQDPDDPTTWIWSDNPALAILDWIAMHPKGYKIDRARMDIPSFEVMADRCDEPVPLKTGGAEKRYRVAMRVTLDQPRTDVLGKLRDSCDAHVYKTGDGLWAIRGGAWEEPTETLDTEAGHIIEAEMRDGVDAVSRYNELTIRFLSPDHHYVETDAWPYLQEDDVEYLDGVVKTKSLSMSQVPSQGQAHRLAKIFTAYDNPDWIGSVRTNYFGLHLIGSRTVTLNWSEPGETLNDTFWLESDMVMLENGTGMRIRVRSAKKESYWWYPTEEPDRIKPLPPPEVEYTEGVPPANVTDFAVGPASGITGALTSWTVPDANFYIGRVWRADHAVNYLLQSENLSAAAYTKVALSAFGAGSVSDTMATLDPIGTNTADFLQLTAASTTHGTVQNVSGLTPNQELTFARWFKYQSGGPVAVKLYLIDASATLNNIFASFNIETGTVIATGQQGTASGVSASVVPGPDGWFLCVLQGQPSAAGVGQTRVTERAATAAGSDTVLGDGVYGYWIWRGQLGRDLLKMPLISTGATAVILAPFDNAVEVSGPQYLPRDQSTGYAMEYFDPVRPGDYDYYITVENAGGDRNTPVGPTHYLVT
jgi:hypothetical protein